MREINEIYLNKLRNKYPEGTKVRLINMDDIQAPPKGTIGEVIYIDDLGTIHVNWENGSSLGLVPREDDWEIVKEDVINS